MSPILSTILIVASIILALLTTVLIRQNKMPIKYSLLWYAFALLVLLTGAIPNIVSIVANFFGFQTISNFLLGVIVGVMVLLNIALTVMIASQRHRIKLISQELSLLKKEVSDARKTKN